jgi:hypothetical protein
MSKIENMENPKNLKGGTGEEKPRSRRRILVPDEQTAILDSLEEAAAIEKDIKSMSGKGEGQEEGLETVVVPKVIAKTEKGELNSQKKGMGSLFGGVAREIGKKKNDSETLIEKIKALKDEIKLLKEQHALAIQTSDKIVAFDKLKASEQELEKLEESRPKSTRKKQPEKIVKESKPEITESEVKVEESNNLAEKIATLEKNLDSFLKFSAPQLKDILIEVSAVIKEAEENKAEADLVDRFRKAYHTLFMRHNELIEIPKGKTPDEIANDVLGKINKRWEEEKVIAKSKAEEIPSIDKSLTETARNVSAPKEKIEENIPEKNEQKEIPKWEDLIDQWIESKIREEMEKRHINRQDAEENLKAKFKEKLPNIFRDVAVHKSPWSWQETDLDGRVCLGLLGLAGWRTDKGATITFLDPNARLANKVHMDVGKYDGVAFLEQTDSGLKLLELFDEEGIKNKDRGKRFFANLGVIIDHHPDGAPSAAGMVFKLLDKFRMFENNRNIGRNDVQAISRMVEFIDLTDSQGFQEVGKPENWNKSDKTILGLHRFMKFPDLLKFFKEDGGYNRELTEEELKKYGLVGEIEENGEKRKINRQEQQRRVIDGSSEKLKEFEKNGFIIETKFGKTIIDAKGELPGGAFVAQSIGASYLKWNAKEKTIFMFSDKELNKDLFDVGFRVRKHLWLVPEDTKETGLTLNKVIEKIGGKIMPESGLEDILRNETKITEKEPEVASAPEPTTQQKPIDDVGIPEEPPLTFDEQIKKKEEEIQRAEDRMAIYRPIGWFEKKPVVRDLSYYGLEGDLNRLKNELKELKSLPKDYKTMKKVEVEPRKEFDKPDIKNFEKLPEEVITTPGKKKIGFLKRLFSKKPERILTEKEIEKEIEKKILKKMKPLSKKGLQSRIDEQEKKGLS